MRATSKSLDVSYWWWCWPLLWVIFSTILGTGLACVVGHLTPWISVVSLVTGAILSEYFLPLRQLPILRLADKTFWVTYRFVISALLIWMVVLWHWFGRSLAVTTKGQWVTAIPSDLPMHMGFIQFFVRGASFWPVHPLFAAERFHYPFGVDFFSAFWVQLGVPLHVVLTVMGMMFSGILVGALYRWAGWIALLGFVFSGSLASLSILFGVNAEQLLPWLMWKNLFLSLWLTQRGWLVALPLGLILLTQWFDTRDEKPCEWPTWLQGFLLAALPLFHIHTYGFLFITLGVWLFFTEQWRRYGWTFGLGGVIGLVVTAVLLMPFDSLQGIHWEFFLSQEPGHPIDALLCSWGPVLMVWGVVECREQSSKHGSLRLIKAYSALWFLLLMVVSLAPWVWDNTKVLLWVLLLWLWIIHQHLSHDKAVSVWVKGVIFAMLTLPGVMWLVAGWQQPPQVIVENAKAVPEVCQTLASLSPNEVIATTPRRSMASLCGQPVVSGKFSMMWSHAVNIETVQHPLWCLIKGASDWPLWAQQLGVRYLLWTDEDTHDFRWSDKPWLNDQPMASGSGWALYDLTTLTSRAMPLTTKCSGVPTGLD